MTQTPPKPTIQKIASRRTSVSQTSQIQTRTSPNASSPQSVEQPASESKKAKANFWQNLSFQWKLTLLLMTTAAIPVFAVTALLNKFAGDQFLRDLTATVSDKNLIFTEEYVLWTNEEAKADADSLVQTVQEARIDLRQPKQVEGRRSFVQNLLLLRSDVEPESIKSFKILTDAQGRTVAQNIQVLAEDFSKYPLLPAKDTFTPQQYRSVSLPSGIALGDVPIVKAALSTGRPLAGMELLKGDYLKRLGLDKQANIGLRPQVIKDLPENKQPFPAGTYDIDEGKAGFVSMAVYPIRVNGQLVGTAIVGTLLNRNNGLTDKFTHKYPDIPVATIFAQDWRVATTVPHVDQQTRAKDGTRSIGTLVAREVAQTVLNRGERFLGKTNVAGLDYLTAYTPVYDYRKTLDPQTKPIGFVFAAKPLTEVNKILRQQQLLGYGIGLGSLFVVGLIAVPLAGTFSRPLRRLAGFAQQVAEGETGVRLETTDRQDEIGVLSQELNQMAVQIETNLEAIRQKADREQLLKEVTLDLSQYPQVKTAFDTALEILRLFLQADRAFFYRFNEETWEGSVVAESVADGWPRALGALITDHCFKDQFVEPYRQGRFQATANIYEAGFTDCHIKILEPFAIKANLVLPILRGSRGILTGLLCVNQCSTARVWEEAEIALLTQVATQFGLALDRANLIEKTRTTAERAQALKDITLKMAQAINPEAIFNTAVAEIRQAIRSDRVIVYQFDKNWKGTVIAESVADGFPKALGAEIADPCFADKYVGKYKQGRVQPTSDIYKAGLTECHLKQLEPFGIKANLVAPILVGGELLGLLIAHQCSEPRNWESGEVDFFAQIATQVGLALERANLLETQRSEKEKLQKRALELLQQVDPISQGDLTIRARVTDDEIGTVADSYNSTIESLRKIVAQVKTAATQMTVTTSQNQDFVQSLSVEAVRQAEEIADALKRVQLMTTSIREVTANAKQAEMAVQQAAQTVKAGDTAMNRTVDRILAIRETVVETSEKVKRLGESSQKISKIVGLIGRFAAQTHMLALKASIEAARAGDEGQGFAVIADEVRSLAAQSAEATAEISNLVASIQSETNEVATAMQAGTEQVMTGTRLVEETRQNLTQIAQVSDQINRLVKAIAKAADEQSQSSEVVSHSMTEVAAISTKTSTEATQVSTSFKELLTVAQELQKSVGQFKVS
jgi:methyl-accepting chemotaxis protein PixJ